ncbi:unnamed protein product [Victoria cruziana]
MADTIDVILDYLRRHRFTKAEAALRGEIVGRQESNGELTHPSTEGLNNTNRDDGAPDRGSYAFESSRSGKVAGQVSGSLPSSDSSAELIVKEVECGNVRSSSGRTWENNSAAAETSLSLSERRMVNESAGTSEKSFVFQQGSTNLQSFGIPSLSADLYPWALVMKADGNLKSSATAMEKISDLRLSGHPEHHNVYGLNKINSVKSVKTVGDSSGCCQKNSSLIGEFRNLRSKNGSSDTDVMEAIPSWSAFGGNGSEEKHHRVQREHNDDSKTSKVFETIPLEITSDGSKHGALYLKDQALEYTWTKDCGTSCPPAEAWKECSIKTLFPFSMADETSGYRNVTGTTSGRSDGSGKGGKQDDEGAELLSSNSTHVPQTSFIGTSKATFQHTNTGNRGVTFNNENHKEELPRLPPVKLKSEEKSGNIHWEEKAGHYGLAPKPASVDNAFSIGSFLDVPVGQDINSSGGRKTAGSSWLSVSQGIAEDTSDFVSGFATAGDGLSESIDYPNEYWDSDEYEDDDDVGYMRQPIEDESWFLAHEIDYPSDNEKGTVRGSAPDHQDRSQPKDDDDQSFAEEDSYFSGEQYIQAKNIEQVAIPEDPVVTMTEMYGRTDENDLIAQYDGQLMDEEELNLMRAEPVWQGFVTQTSELIMLSGDRGLKEHDHHRHEDPCIDEDQHGSVRSIGVGINSDVADFGSEVRESLIGESSEGDLEYFPDQDTSVSESKKAHQEKLKMSCKRVGIDKPRAYKSVSGKSIIGPDSDGCALGMGYDGGFSFPSPLRAEEMVKSETDKAFWSMKGDGLTAEDDTDDGAGQTEADDMLASWRRKSTESSPDKSSRDEGISNTRRSQSSSSAVSNSYYGYGDREQINNAQDEKVSDTRDEDAVTTLEDEEAAAVQEQVRQIKAQEEEFETFNLKIVHRKNRTGFEEDKNFHVVLNSVIAGRYHVTEYLGSAAFSKAIQAHDLHTGMDVCVKIIKNNKDFFDQSLDEIKLLKFVNKHDPGDRYHILRLYDYFYYREHLLIVCELLKANLYEFHKFNRESGGEVYFTMPRLQSITIQCLEALQFLHSLGLIHCDLKPENILVKSYSRCEVKVIDLGSSCFETDHLCSYVQSRSYRAPEVILGLPYDKKIDVWSLGCILAELCTGNVLFQNDSPATLLARVVGIIGSIDQDMLAKGRDTYKYFTKNHMLYERNQDTNKLEYLIPKKSSLRHRLPMGDQGFIDFVGHLLEVNPRKRPTASEALKHPWLSFPYEPISS